MKNLSLTIFNSKKIKKKFLIFKHWIKKEKFLWGLEITSLGAKLGFAEKIDSWEEFDKKMGWK